MLLHPVVVTWLTTLLLNSVVVTVVTTLLLHPSVITPMTNFQIYENTSWTIKISLGFGSNHFGYGKNIGIIDKTSFENILEIFELILSF